MHIIILIETDMEDCTSTFTFHHSVSAGTVVYSKVAGFHHLVLLLDLLRLGAALVLCLLAKLVSCGPTTEATLSECYNRRRLNGLPLGHVFWPTTPQYILFFSNFLGAELWQSRIYL